MNNLTCPKINNSLLSECTKQNVIDFRSYCALENDCCNFCVSFDYIIIYK